MPALPAACRSPRLRAAAHLAAARARTRAHLADAAHVARRSATEAHAAAHVSQQLQAAPLRRRMDALAAEGNAARGAPAPLPAAASSPVGIDSLPRAVLLNVFAALPCVERARVALIQRSWRDALAEPAAWARLDLSRDSGVSVALSDALLRGAAARARGQLTALVLEDPQWAISFDALLEVVTANVQSLSELSCFSAGFSSVEVERLARAAPQLRVFLTKTDDNVASAARKLRNDAPFGALRLRSLALFESPNTGDADVMALAAALPGHTSLRQLDLNRVSLRTPAVFDALADAVTRSAVSSLSIYGCGLSPASVPALARILHCGALTSLTIYNDNGPGHPSLLLEAPSALLLADAIAANRTLLHQRLIFVEFWEDAAAAAAVMRAVTGHPRLQELDLSRNSSDDAEAKRLAGASLGALVGANAPSLQKLSFELNGLSDEGMRPLLQALPHNTHLPALDCQDAAMTEDFARDIFLPAVRINTSLRALYARERWPGEPHALMEAETLVFARNAIGGC